jgi:hypothetical protein
MTRPIRVEDDPHTERILLYCKYGDFDARLMLSEAEYVRDRLDELLEEE